MRCFRTAPGQSFFRLMKTKNQADQTATKPGKKKPIVRRAPKPPQGDQFPPNLRIYNFVHEKLSKKAAELGRTNTNLASSVIEYMLDRIDSGAVTVDSQGTTEARQVTPAEPERLPIFLSRGLVQMLRAVIENAADCEGGLEAYIEEHLANEALDSIKDPTNGITSLIDELYVFGSVSEQTRVFRAMKVEVAKWEHVDGKFEPKGGKPA